MTTTVALIHTASMLAPTLTELCRAAMPDVEFFNIVDESLLKNTIAAGEVTPTTTRRLAGYLESAEAAGADVILVTCSSIGPAVEAARPLVNTPVLRIDQAMADQAVRLAVAQRGRIGVIATLPTTLTPTVALVEARATVQGVQIEIVTVLCEGAFDAVVSGDTVTHDRLVREGLSGLMSQVDVVVLAQASMARVVDSLSPEEKIVPVLSSPQLGVAALKEVVDAL
ncbi:MAG: aspartate/glutamate racemase family protein [Caldilineaceae bacterium]|nr:aspartate/glutamate racemase family protein [Caldilineaceae bacterium]